MLVTRRDVEDFNIVEPGIGGQLCGQCCRQIAIADDVAEGWQLVIVAVDHGPAETIFLGDVNGFDRRCGARRPGFDLLQQLVGTIG